MYINEWGGGKINIITAKVIPTQIIKTEKIYKRKNLLSKD